jgi:drug/metabolite transporter (DMT)-like permease
MSLQIDTPPAGPLPAERSLSNAGLTQLFLSVVLLSSAWPLTKIALRHGAAPLWFAEGRAILSGLVAALLLLPRHRLRLPRRADLPTVIAVGILQLGVYFALSHLALRFVPAGRTSVLANTTTVWVVPLSLIVLGESIPPRRWLAALCGVLGIAVLMGPWAIDWTAPGVLEGHALLLGAALAWAIAIIVMRRWRPHSSMLALLPWCFLIASMLLGALLAIEAPGGGIGHDLKTWDLNAWMALAYIGLIAGPLGTWFVLEATSVLPTVVSSIGFLATPAVGIVLSNLLLGEPFTPDLLAGSALILGGVGLAAWPSKRGPSKRGSGKRGPGKTGPGKMRTTR